MQSQPAIAARDAPGVTSLPGFCHSQAVYSTVQSWRKSLSASEDGGQPAESARGPVCTSTTQFAAQLPDVTPWPLCAPAATAAQVHCPRSPLPPAPPHGAHPAIPATPAPPLPGAALPPAQDRSPPSLQIHLFSIPSQNRRPEEDMTGRQLAPTHSYAEPPRRLPFGKHHPGGFPSSGPPGR